ncbi:hypothetical protein, partial [Enterovirga sp. CN4-39]|uniref:hypothetical protein n=1 Tax=Enterovirga sp. CN4-39 TaxID=3400910 RepID=UPI003C0F4255
MGWPALEIVEQIRIRLRRQRRELHLAGKAPERRLGILVPLAAGLVVETADAAEFGLGLSNQPVPIKNLLREAAGRGGLVRGGRPGRIDGCQTHRWRVRHWPRRHAVGQHSELGARDRRLDGLDSRLGRTIRSGTRGFGHHFGLRGCSPPALLLLQLRPSKAIAFGLLSGQPHALLLRPGRLGSLPPLLVRTGSLLGQAVASLCRGTLLCKLPLAGFLGQPLLLEPSRHGLPTLFFDASFPFEALALPSVGGGTLLRQLLLARFLGQALLLDPARFRLPALFFETGLTLEALPLPNLGGCTFLRQLLLPSFLCQTLLLRPARFRLPALLFETCLALEALALPGLGGCAFLRQLLLARFLGQPLLLDPARFHLPALLVETGLAREAL